MGRYAVVQPLPGEIGGDIGRYGEIWGEMGRYLDAGEEREGQPRLGERRARAGLGRELEQAEAG